ncbi:hypothetical protein Ancab_013989 [Ancistrocladus abbreviatus]
MHAKHKVNVKMACTRIDQAELPSNAISISTVELSIQHLIKIWQRRQKWQKFLQLGKDFVITNGASWRIHLANFLESTSVRLISILLLISDLVLTITELSSSLISCGHRETAPKEVWYHWLGIVILSILCLKTVLLVIGFGGSFFRKPGYVVDGGAAVGALVLEGLLEKVGGGLLVAVSLWRVVRVVEGALELSDEAIEAQVEEIMCQFEALREENRRLLRIISEKDEIIEKLSEEIDDCCPI